MSATTRTLLSYAVLAASLVSTLTLLALNLSGPPGAPGSLNGYGASDVYVGHPVLMCLAFLLLFPVGMVSHALEAPALGERARHALHGGCNLLGTLCSLLGFTIAFVYHQVKLDNGLQKNSHSALSGEVGTHATWTRPAHAILGYIVLLGLLVQSAAGLGMHAFPALRGAAILFHRRVGPALWVGGLACICLAGVFEWLEVPPQDKPHWSGGQLAAIFVTVGLLAAGVLGLLGLGRREGKGDEQRETLLSDAALN
jgi:hypothetical protein